MQTAIESTDCPHITYRAYATLYGVEVEPVCKLDQKPCEPEECLIFTKYKEDKDVETE